METFTMSRKELPRPGLLKAARAGKITNREGAAALHLSIRQFQRLKRRYEAAGAPAVRHRGRGQPSPRRFGPALREQIATLLQTRYAGFNDTHLTEKLRELHQLSVSRESVRRLRLALGVPAVHRRRPPKHRSRRAREAALGQLLQIDGSPFAWLEARGPEMTLLGAIDDASSQVLALHFRPHEDLHGYATVFHQVFTASGLPVALYGDGINVLVRNDSHWSLEEELQGAQHPTHLGRVLQDLGIGYVQARSPQAKGRIERLWGTLQDRLVSELRLRGLATAEAANAFLPAFLADFNARFAQPPQAATPVWRRPPRDLDRLLSCRYQRRVARDNTVRLGPRWIQLPPGPGGRSYAGRRVEVRELLDGRLLVFADGALLASHPSPGPDFVLKPRRAPNADRLRPHRPRPQNAATDSPQDQRSRRRPGAEDPSHPARPASLAHSRPTSTPAPTHPWRTSITRRGRALAAAWRG
jgi:transposase